jgi:hypothetical protein
MQWQLKDSSVRQFTAFKETIAIAVAATFGREKRSVFVYNFIVDDVNSHREDLD